MATNDREKSKGLPKDAQVIISILKELGVDEFENRVINQLLEFTYRYVTCILDDAKVFANHAKKKIIDVEDVKLASTMLLDKAFTGPPPKDVLLEVARQKNAQPLPFIRPHSGLRLPPDRFCLLACNYKLRAASSGAGTAKKLTKSAIEHRSSIKTLVTPSRASTNVGSSAIKQQSSLAQSQAPKIQTVTMPKPVFKTGGQVKPKNIVLQQPKSEMIMEIDEINENISIKRKRSEDDYEVS